MVNVYDFDNTIYNGDSTLSFFLYCLEKHPNIAIYIPVQVFYFLLYLFKMINKTQFKEKFYIFLKGIDDIDYEIDIFWQKNIKKIKEWYYCKHKDTDVVISASPEFLLAPICNTLNISFLIASRVNKTTGKYNGLNCYGEEKVRRLIELYPEIKIKEFYSDSFSDQSLADLAEISFLVKDNELYKWN